MKPLRAAAAPTGVRPVLLLTALLLATALLVTACSAGGDGPRPAGTGPTPAAGSTPGPSAGPSAGPSVIDRAPDPTTVPSTRPAAVATGAAAQRRNEVGEAWTLDEAAAAACAQAEFALTDLDEGEDPAGHLAAAVRAAAPSGAEAVRAAAVSLSGGAAGRASVVAFLTVCTQGGYEL